MVRSEMSAPIKMPIPTHAKAGRANETPQEQVLHQRIRLPFDKNQNPLAGSINVVRGMGSIGGGGG